ncbi:MAG: phenylacetate--CoA ligase family protein [Methanonatronarchaeia archaeon]|nr:MAG: phenylacetate--CoA ligase family protein [Methanonatronarchaeia archaeon]
MDLDGLVKQKIIKKKNHSLDEHGSQEIIGRELIDRYKESMVIDRTRYAFKNSPYYRETFLEEGIDIDEIIDIQSFRDKVPLTSLEDITGNHYRVMAVTRNDIFRGFTDNGKRVLYTKDELKELVNAISAGLKTIGIDNEDRLLITFPKETDWGCPFLVKMAAEECECQVRHTEHLTADKQVEEINRYKPTAIIGSHPYLYTLAKTIDRMEDINLHKGELSKLIMSRGCIYYPFDEEIRGEIERIFNCDVYDHYGTTETGFAVAMECPEKNGLHVNEADFYTEIIDPDTLEPLPPSEEGELVITTLRRDGMPMIRYRTGDITSIDESKHGCGQDLIRLKGIRGEVENKYPSSQNLPFF